jgi:hypothetical protein
MPKKEFILFRISRIGLHKFTSMFVLIVWGSFPLFFHKKLLITSYLVKAETLCFMRCFVIFVCNQQTGIHERKFYERRRE